MKLNERGGGGGCGGVYGLCAVFFSTVEAPVKN